MQTQSHQNSHNEGLEHKAHLAAALDFLDTLNAEEDASNRLHKKKELCLGSLTMLAAPSLERESDPITHYIERCHA